MFCGSCVTKLPVYRMNYVDPAFVCKKCESTCTAEADFYEHHLKILCKGIKLGGLTASASGLGGTFYVDHSWQELSMA